MDIYANVVAKGTITSTGYIINSGTNSNIVLDGGGTMSIANVPQIINQTVTNSVVESVVAEAPKFIFINQDDYASLTSVDPDAVYFVTEV